MTAYDDRNLTQRRKRNRIVAILASVWSPCPIAGKGMMVDMANALIEAGYEVKKNEKTTEEFRSIKRIKKG
jgi:hypothetical protein